LAAPRAGIERGGDAAAAAPSARGSATAGGAARVARRAASAASVPSTPARLQGGRGGRRVARRAIRAERGPFARACQPHWPLEAHREHWRHAIDGAPGAGAQAVRPWAAEEAGVARV